MSSLKTSATLVGAAAALLAAPAAQATVPSNNGKVAFTRQVAAGNSDIFAVQPNGTGLTQLTDGPGLDRDVSFSPDGSKIAFASDRGGNLDIYVADATPGAPATQLTSDVGADTEPAWSPDGSRIAFTSDRDGDTEIYVTDAAPGAPATQLTDNTLVTVRLALLNVVFGHDKEPAWSPDGKRIAFVSDRAPRNNYETYVMNADGTGQTQLTTTAGTEGEPSWAPDGSRIAMASTGFLGDGIYLGGPVPGGLTSLANDVSVDSGPSFAPDGKKIAYRSTFAASGFGIYVMNADGSGVTRLTGANRDSDPDWQPCATCTPPPPPAAPAAPSGPVPVIPAGPPANVTGAAGSTGATLTTWTAIGTAPKVAVASKHAGGAPGAALYLTAWARGLAGADRVRVATHEDSHPSDTVRLLGVTTRRLGRCGPAATRAMRAWLFQGSTGRRLAVVSDWRAPTRDAGGALVAYLQRGHGSVLQESLLARGLARVDTSLAKHFTLLPRFRRAQARAQHAKRGIWGACAAAKKRA